MSGIILRHKSAKSGLQLAYILDNMVLFGIKLNHKKEMQILGKIDVIMQFMFGTGLVPPTGVEPVSNP